MNDLISAIDSGQWLLAAGAVLVLATEGVKRLAAVLGHEVPTEWQPWLAALLGVSGGIGTCLLAGQCWWQAILTGGTAGATAGGLWSLLARHVLKAHEHKPTK